MDGRFDHARDELELTMRAPGIEPQSAVVDVSWIAYADQADRLAMTIRQALREIEAAFTVPLRIGQSAVQDVGGSSFGDSSP